MASFLEPNRITDRILQNGYIDVTDAMFLKKQGVTHIVNLHEAHPDLDAIRATGLVVRHVPVTDMEPMSDAIALAVVDAIRACLSEGTGRVYVHCWAGCDRSPTAVWLYLLATGHSEQDATAILHRANPLLSAPNRTLVMDLDLARIRGRYRPRAAEGAAGP